MTHYARATRSLFPDSQDDQIDDELAIEEEISRESTASASERAKHTLTHTHTHTHTPTNTDTATTKFTSSSKATFKSTDTDTSTDTSSSTSTTSTAELSDSSLDDALLSHNLVPDEPPPTLKQSLQLYECESCHDMKYNRAYWEAFHIAVCNDCRKLNAEQYQLMTKTDAKTKYGCSDDDLRELPYQVKQNPHQNKKHMDQKEQAPKYDDSWLQQAKQSNYYKPLSRPSPSPSPSSSIPSSSLHSDANTLYINDLSSRWSAMKLYRYQDVLAIVNKKYGSLQGLEQHQQQKSIAKLDKRMMNEQKKRKREEHVDTMKKQMKQNPRSHVHRFEDVPSRPGVQRCECGMECEYEEL